MVLVRDVIVERGAASETPAVAAALEGLVDPATGVLLVLVVVVVVAVESDLPFDVEEEALLEDALRVLEMEDGVLVMRRGLSLRTGSTPDVVVEDDELELLLLLLLDDTISLYVFLSRRLKFRR